MSNGLLSNKVGLIVGVANERSLAWGIAQAAHAQGAKLIFTYFDKIPKLEDRVKEMASTVKSTAVYPCNVSDEKSVANLMDTIEKDCGQLDFIIHAVAFADKNELRGRFMDTTQTHFSQCLDISAFSLISLTKAAYPLLKQAENPSIITLTYLGSEKVVPNYNLMGVAKAALEANVRYLAADLGQDNIRINGISAGPIRTLAASGIGGFKDMLKYHETTAPLKRLTTQEEVGDAAVYLTSALSRGVTGEIHYVDGGANILGPTPVLST